MPRQKPKKELKINKSISIPIGVFNQVFEQSMVMDKDFSATVTVLLRIALSQRKAEEMKDREEIEEEAKKILGMIK